MPSFILKYAIIEFAKVIPTLICFYGENGQIYANRFVRKGRFCTFALPNRLGTIQINTMMGYY